MNLSYIKTASQPVGEAGDPYAAYDCPTSRPNELRPVFPLFHKNEPAVAAKRTTGNAAERSPTTAVSTFDVRLYATHDALDSRTVILNICETAGGNESKSIINGK